MIIGHTFMSHGVNGSFFDTAIPTDNIDELTLNGGVYDEVFVSVDTSLPADNVKPTGWQLKHIIDAKFKNDIEAGSIDANGFKIDGLLIYRRKFEPNAKWVLVGETDYQFEYNVYSFVDKTVQNGVTYEYAILPKSKEVLGEITQSAPVTVNYYGSYISDINDTYRMNLDFELGEISHHRNSATLNPMNGRYPVVVFGSQNYKSGSMSFLPVTEEHQKHGGPINKANEYKLRESIVNFLNNGASKIIRNESGEILIVAITDVKTAPKADWLHDVQKVSFNYTEVGKIEGNSLKGMGLIGQAVKSKYTYNENGEILWEN